jgi:FAD/FMN-containing dehydrogenase
MTVTPGTPNPAATGARAEATALAGRLAGPVFTPGDPGYDEEIAPFNLATAHRPPFVVGAADTDDVAQAVRFAAERGLPVGVQATGHGPVTAITDGVLISTKRMADVRIDPAGRTVTIGAGVRWADLVTAAAEHGLAPLCGSSSGVGAVGFTLGGGLPVLGRTFGFAADHVHSFEVVTADGAIRHVDADHEPELFWGMRGGKGNFGIVTVMTIDLVPVPRLYGGAIFYPGEAAPAVLEAYRDWAPGLPETTCTSLSLLRLPPIPEIPEPLRGQFVVHLRVALTGDAAEGERLVAPMRAAAPAMIDAVAEMPYTAIDSIHQDPVHPTPAYERSTMLRDLTPQVVQTLLDVAGPGVETPVLMVELRQLGGALAREPEVPNAVGGRDAGFALFVVGVLAPPIAAIVPRAVDATVAAFAAESTGRTFVNMHGVPGDDADRGRPWPAATYRRLQELKARYDPEQTFRFGHAIPPHAPLVPEQR